jgi:Zn-dependent protease with chaperone function
MERDVNVDGPALSLPPLVLPPAGADIVPSRSFARRALLSVLLMVGVLVVGLATIIGLVLVNVAIVMSTGRIYFYLIAATLVVAGGTAKGLIAAVKKPPTPRDELLLPRAEQPELYATVAALAAVVGTDPPDRIVLVPEVNAYVREFGPFMGLKRGERTLAIGAPLLDALDVSQLGAVLGHELGHFAGGDTRLGPVAYRTEQSLRQIVTSLRGHATAAIFVAYANFQNKMSASARRDQELIADRAAVRVSGRQVAADALWAIEIASRAEIVLRVSYLRPLVGAGCKPADLRTGFRCLLADPARVRSLLESKATDPDVDDWSSHPPTPQRIERVAAVPEHGAVTRDTRGAYVLLREPDRWIKAVNDQWLLHAAPNTINLSAVPWSQLIERVVQPKQEALAADVRGVLAQIGLPDGLEGIHRALTSGRDRELAAALVARGWRAPGANERHVVLRTAIEAVAGTTAAHSGTGTWALSWSGPAELRLANGQPCALRELSEHALSGTWEPLFDTIMRGSMSTPATMHPPGASVGGAPPAPNPTDAVNRAVPVASPLGPAPRPSPGPMVAMPPPPSPPFVPAAAPWRTEARFSATLPGKKHVLRIGDHGIEINGTAVPFDSIEHAAVRVKGEGVTSFAVTISVTPNGGAPVTMVIKASEKQRQPAARAANYAWIALRVHAAPRLVAQVVERVRAGEQVVVGGLIFSTGGIARPNDKAVHPWPTISDARSTPTGQVISSGGTILIAKNGSEDEFLVPDLVVQLRTYFA